MTDEQPDQAQHPKYYLCRLGPIGKAFLLRESDKNNSLKEIVGKE